MQSWNSAGFMDKCSQYILCHVQGYLIRSVTYGKLMEAAASFQVSFHSCHYLVEHQNLEIMKV